jgi:hypothetical protein
MIKNVFRYTDAETSRGVALVVESLRPKDYAAMNKPLTKESKETLRRRAVRLAKRVKALEAALQKVLSMEPVTIKGVPMYRDTTGAIGEARLVLKGEPFWNA